MRCSARRGGTAAVTTAAAAVAVVAVMVATVVATRARRRRTYRQVGDRELEAQVTAALAVDPRSWWLPQPQVEVREATIMLSGQCPHADAHDAVLAVVRAGAPASAIRDRLVVV